MLALRSDTDIPTSLFSSLMGLAVSTPPLGTAGLPKPARPTVESAVPPVPALPSGSRVSAYPLHDPVPTVHPAAPALHRSPVRAAVVASIAAGASVAAAWGLAVVPLQGPVAPVEARMPSEASSPGSAAFGITSLAAAGFMVGSSSSSSTSTQPNRTTRRAPSASTVASYWVVTPQVHDFFDRPAVAPVRMPFILSAQSTP